MLFFSRQLRNAVAKLARISQWKLRLLGHGESLPEIRVSRKGLNPANARRVIVGDALRSNADVALECQSCARDCAAIG